MYMAKSLKDKKKNYIIFHTIFFLKNMYWHAFWALINSLLKPWKLGQYFKKYKKIILFF